MNQLLKNFIPLGDTGSICYFQDILKDFDSNNIQLIQSRLKELQSQKIQKLILLRSWTKKIDFDAITEILESSKFQFSIYTPNSPFQEQVELFETIVDSHKEENICILYHGVSPSLIELITKLVLYVDSKTPIEEIYSYITEETPDIITLGEFKNYIEFLENDPYLITKPDRSEFRKLSSTNGKQSELAPQIVPGTNTEFTLNLNSLQKTIPDNEPLLTETEAIQFNLNSLVESDFEKEESPEEHNQKLRETAQHKIEDSLSLDVDLSEEIEYINSLENLSTPTMDKISITNIDTVPLDDPPPISHQPTIDYKTKEYIDFDAIIEDELEQGMLTGEISENFLENDSVDFPDSIDLETIIPDDKDNSFSFDEEIHRQNSAINLDIVETQANIDLSFPSPIDHMDDLLEEKMEMEHEKDESLEDPIDPSQTFMVRRINDVIKKEVLNEDSKSKIPVSDLTKVETESTEAIKLNTNPTAPKISNPKITSPKFNPITLDD